MFESMHKYMRVGLVHFMAYPSTMNGEGPLVETVRKLAVDDYFNVIEITWIKNGETRAQVKKMLDSSHMTVAYGGQPRLLTTGLNINDLNEEGRLKAVETLKEGIDEAYEMGAVGFAFLSGKYEEDQKEQAYEALLASTRELCRYAKSKGGLRVVHEVFDYDIDKKSLVGPAALAKRYAEDITKEFDNFGLMVDLSHIPLIKETAEEAILPIKDYIVHAHMGNCVVKEPSLPAYGDVHPRFGFPGGENDMDELVEYLRLLLQIGFLNESNPPIVSFEVKPFGDEDPDIVVANAKRTLNLAWARV
ncbi:sugar phosphate isomerase/epimerase [Paenibacillus sp. YN15]|uniref:sugar phosphate isomerase/epimerase family protein n=1 Tax=Paenibacillus sp. YN15 TaxID=1742774 RepID=UPI000DCBE81D|nr:sugar phosphate isomerase/epimerase [Paenibacillus sp. YN15]RAV04965.1 sugar phosphate isomerase/epimerase [Paenibacillus sp. YN15]